MVSKEEFVKQVIDYYKGWVSYHETITALQNASGIDQILISIWQKGGEVPESPEEREEALRKLNVALTDLKAKYPEGKPRK